MSKDHSISDSATTMDSSSGVESVPAPGSIAEPALPWGRHDFVLRDGVKRWLLQDRLGKGGSGSVWRALDLLRGERPVALKFVPLGGAGSHEVFLNEAGKSARMDDARVVRVLDVAIVDGWGVLVEELLEDGTLADRLRVLRGQGSSLPVAELDSLVRGVLEALQVVHGHGLVHRDIKPANLALRNGQIVLLDLGIAARSGALGDELSWGNPGTRGYMPPEQERDALAVLPNADLYALGATAMSAWTLERPSKWERPFADAVPLVGLPERLRRSILKSVEVEPTRRWQTAADWLADLDGVEEPAAPPPPPSRPEAPARPTPPEAPTPPTPPASPPVAPAPEVREWKEKPPASPPPEPPPAPRRSAGWKLGAVAATAVMGLLCLAGALLLPEVYRSWTETVEIGSRHSWLEGQGYPMVSVAGGEFVMGSAANSPGHEADEVAHSVEVGPFDLGATEVSQALYRRVMGDNPAATATRDWMGSTDGGACSTWGVGDGLPVHCVSWEQAVVFCNMLSDSLGLPVAYERPEPDPSGPGWEPVTEPWRRIPGSTGYRLPTEAEWEWAARAGRADGRYAGTDSDAEICNYANVSNPSTRAAHSWMKWDMFDCEDGYAELAPVRSFRPNSWGFHDMTGNVWEWVEDAYLKEYEELGRANPVAYYSLTDNSGAIRLPVDLTKRVVRGGSWQRLDITRVANRYFGGPEDRSWYVGFRIARSR